jgi:hypothetical protein
MKFQGKLEAKNSKTREPNFSQNNVSAAQIQQLLDDDKRFTRILLEDKALENNSS